MKNEEDRMIIAFPTQEDEGLESRIYGHFGSASRFIVMDSEKGSFEVLVNGDREHHHGRCQPLNALGGRRVDAVVVGGIGGGALSKLNAAGVKVYRAVEGSIGENLKLIQSGFLPVFTLDQTCAGHGAGGGCVH
jgi:predicted Fe-Mo cluster-binding NifX family protein